MTIPQFTWEDYERDFADRHLLHAVVAKWARERPDHTAIIEFDTGREVTYRQFDDETTALALRLIELGYRPGDYLATMLPLTVEHIFLEYACFKIGVIHAPLDMRLKPDEVVRSLGLIQAKGFVMLGRTPAADFTPVAEAVRASCGYVEHLVQFADADSLRRRRDLGNDLSTSARQHATIRHWSKQFEETTSTNPADRRRPSDLYDRLDRLSETGTAFAPQHHGRKTFAWPAAATGSTSGECWSICRRRTLAARAKS